MIKKLFNIEFFLCIMILGFVGCGKSVERTEVNKGQIIAVLNQLSAPKNLLAKANDAFSIVLEWENTSTNADSIIVERCTTSCEKSESFVQIVSLASTLTTYTDLNLTTDTKYTYQLAAVSAGKKSCYSNQASATPKQEFVTPNAPFALRITKKTSDSLTLVWNGSGNEDGYLIEQKTGQNNYQLIKTISISSSEKEHSHVNSGLAEGTVYFYRIRAYQGTKISEYSNEVSSWTLLKTPSDFMIEETSQRVLNAKWMDHSSKEGFYKINFKVVEPGNEEDANEWDQSIKTTCTTSQCELTLSQNLLSGGTYKFKIRAENIAGMVSEECFSTFTLSPSSTPAIPDLMAMSSGSSAIQLTWITSDSVDGFVLERRLATGIAFKIILDGKQRAYLDEKLVNDTSYIYKIKARIGSYESAFSEEVTAMTGPLRPTDVQAGIKLFSNDADNLEEPLCDEISIPSSYIQVSWKHTSYPQIASDIRFQVFRKSVDEQEFMVLSDQAGYEYRDYSISSEVKYEYYIVALRFRNLGIETLMLASDPSDHVSVIVPDFNPE